MCSLYVESTVNEVITKRMVKQQQMQWSPIGADHLLQTRTITLNDELPDLFAKWYPWLNIGKKNYQKSQHGQQAAWVG